MVKRFLIIFIICLVLQTTYIGDLWLLDAKLVLYGIPARFLLHVSPSLCLQHAHVLTEFAMVKVLHFVFPRVYVCGACGDPSNFAGNYWLS